MPKNKIIFITGTDTGVGKTVATFLLGSLLKSQGFKVGVMKPVQCAGNDAQFLKDSLKLDDDVKVINPFYAPEALSPHLAFRRSGIRFNKQRVLSCLKELQTKYDRLLVEGAGGLMVPLTKGYYNVDLIADLKAQVIIVSRLGLGTINHTLLTINELKQRKIPIKGLIFSQASPGKTSVPERTNPSEIEQLSGIKVLGIIPYLHSINSKTVSRACQQITLSV